MRPCHGRVPFRAEESNGSVSRSRCDGLTCGNCSGDWSIKLKRPAPLFQPGLLESVPPTSVPWQVRRYAARHASNPSLRSMLSRPRPMKTTRDTRGLFAGHGPIGDLSISMCTPWKT